MSDGSVTNVSEPTVAARREAAVWIARMHGPDRTPQVEAGLRAWLNESADHQHAFERANEVWETASQLTDAVIPRMMRWRRVTPVRQLRGKLIAMAAVLALALAAGVYRYLEMPTVRTLIGEQRVVTLEDGTRVSLNTATQISVRYDQHSRRVRMESGEALFDVFKDVNRPFVVEVGDRLVTALGTSFIVRRGQTITAVTLVEGKVSVSPIASNSSAPAVVTLDPGERLTLADSNRVKRDRPNLDKLTAWQRGLVILDSVRLGDAVVEMNRYSDQKLVVDADAGEARVSGVFRVGDNSDFAAAIGRMHQLQIAQEDGRIIISGRPDGHP